jgi:hypothetical protein
VETLSLNTNLADLSWKKGNMVAKVSRQVARFVPQIEIDIV